MAPATRNLLEVFSDKIEAAQTPGRELAGITGATSKVAEQATRIAGVFSLWCNLQALEVEADDTAAAIILLEFYLSEATRLAEAGFISAETAA